MVIVQGRPIMLFLLNKLIMYFCAQCSQVAGTPTAMVRTLLPWELQSNLNGKSKTVAFVISPYSSLVFLKCYNFKDPINSR